MSDGDIYCWVLESEETLGLTVPCGLREGGLVVLSYLAASSILDRSIWRWYSRLLTSALPAVTAALTSLSARTLEGIVSRW